MTSQQINPSSFSGVGKREGEGGREGRRGGRKERWKEGRGRKGRKGEGRKEGKKEGKTVGLFSFFSPYPNARDENTPL